jgi:hypothetical protein
MTYRRDQNVFSVKVIKFMKAQVSKTIIPGDNNLKEV